MTHRRIGWSGQKRSGARSVSTNTPSAANASTAAAWVPSWEMSV